MSGQKVLIRLIVATTVAAIAFSPWLESEAANERRIVVEIRDFKFVPETPAVRPGDIIVWVNKDIVPHTATAKDDSWDSGQIKPGGEWQMIVGRDTAQDYFCRFHPSMTDRLDIESR